MADAAYRKRHRETLEAVRQLFDFLPLNNREKPPVRPFFDDPARIEARLDSLIPDSATKPYDMKELIYAIADEGDFFEIQEALPATSSPVSSGWRANGGRGCQPAHGAGGLPGYRCHRARQARFERFLRCLLDPDPDARRCAGFLPGVAQEYGV